MNQWTNQNPISNTVHTPRAYDVMVAKETVTVLACQCALIGKKPRVLIELGRVWESAKKRPTDSTHSLGRAQPKEPSQSSHVARSDGKRSFFLLAHDDSSPYAGPYVYN
jgi:hypothetical protein